MKLIVGLGNPGADYQLTPHNIGWIVLDALSHYWEVSWENKAKWQAQTALIHAEKILLLKPLTYMNLSGTAVKFVLNYYHIDLDELLVIHDDIDLPFLSVRFQKNRGPAGHNGLKHINTTLASQNYSRMRIGMSEGEGKKQVLRSFSKKDQVQIQSVLPDMVSAIKYFIEQGIEKTANKYNRLSSE